ncbi:hypothetical protein SALBM311S_05254 [Streptomyces alboniger]
MLLGHGWDAARWPDGRPPTRVELDAATGGRPLYLSRIDVHSAVVTTALLDLTPGLGAVDGPLTADAHHAVRAAALAAVTPEQRVEAQRTALARAASLGIGTVHECAGPEISSEDDFTGLLRLAAEEPGPRVVGYWAERDIDKAQNSARSARPETCSSTAPSVRTPPACISRTPTPATPAPPTWTPQPWPPMSRPAPRPASRRASTPSGTRP